MICLRYTPENYSTLYIKIYLANKHTYSRKQGNQKQTHTHTNTRTHKAFYLYCLFCEIPELRDTVFGFKW